MLETPAELAALQATLDATTASAGAHLTDTIDDTRRADAATICARMTGMCLIVVATATADGRPISGPFDGYLLHGSLWFTSSPDAVRIRHLMVRPAVSATYLPGPDFAVWMHGHAEIHDLADPACAGLRRAMIDHYLPIQGPSFAEWVETMDGRAVRIIPDKVVAFTAP